MFLIAALFYTWCCWKWCWIWCCCAPCRKTKTLNIVMRMLTMIIPKACTFCYRDGGWFNSINRPNQGTLIKIESGHIGETEKCTQSTNRSHKTHKLSPWIVDTFYYKKLKYSKGESCLGSVIDPTLQRYHMQWF